MSQARSKAVILKRLQTERSRLEQYLSGLSRDDMLSPHVVGEWTVKDVLAHLADWEAHMLIWLAAARSGDPVKSPDPGLTWEQWDTFNQRVYLAHRDRSLEEVFAYFRDIHNRFMAMVEDMHEEEMLTRGHYLFLGKDAIYDWLCQYAAHDLWGKTQIRNRMKIHGAPKRKPG